MVDKKSCINVQCPQLRVDIDLDQIEGREFELYRTSEISKSCSLNVRELEANFEREEVQMSHWAWYM
jgi:hypothetical protein